MVKLKVNGSWKYFIAFCVCFIFIGSETILISYNQTSIYTFFGMIGIFIGGYWIGLIQKTMEKIK